ncbi:histidine kinase dimerization/phospho-acceptor domain-containing protein [Pseudoprimorskyibacter insulae]|uniref:histidine kinase n=1 Tax=Pseudoprimorskyibacter insulae TaxID=1695997 RepID=A0A2R8AW58_9RHOB|nr:histidine kinase dimerization/phospho-acceptor domain-containing protein [Pseudoprimorskyibacter insulae]SPF80250.1 Sensor protein QseC [Pseudoprimorskyibacter insulae]
MKTPENLSLKLRIGFVVGAVVCVLWLGAAVMTGRLYINEMSRMMDRDLRATAERILPIVLHDLREGRGGDDDDDDRKRVDIKRLDRESGDIAFIVTTADGRILLQSRSWVDLAIPAQRGFSTDAVHRFYVDVSRRSQALIAVAQPLHERKELAVAAIMGLSLPLFVVIPLTFLGIFGVVGRGLAPVDHLRQDMAQRGPNNLSPISVRNMPRELVPVVASTNTLMARLKAAFEAERSFAANAAHELRTPVAGAIAQAQRLQAESRDPQAVARARDIEATLKRLNRYSEKLMQMARAEGARLRVDTKIDIRPVVSMLVDDFARQGEGEALRLDLPDHPIKTDLDADAFGILLRNLLENALRHRLPGSVVDVRLTDTHELCVSNLCQPLDAATLQRVTQRFARGDGAGDGSGLGLSIAHVIAERSNSGLEITAPQDGDAQRFTVKFTF